MCEGRSLTEGHWGLGLHGLRWGFQQNTLPQMLLAGPACLPPWGSSREGWNPCNNEHRAAAAAASALWLLQGHPHPHLTTFATAMQGLPTGSAQMMKAGAVLCPSPLPRDICW